MTAIEAPPRSLVQRLDALQRANEIRTRKAEYKLDLMAGREDLLDALCDPPVWLHSAKIRELLRSCPKFGPVKVDKVLQLCRISPSKSLGGLSPRQRTVLGAMIGHKRSPAMPKRAAKGTSPSSQHMRALGGANETRLARAALRQQIAEGDATVAGVLVALPWEAATMTISDLLMCQHRWGRTRTLKFLASVPMLESKTVGSMTDRARGELVHRLDGTYEPPQPTLAAPVVAVAPSPAPTPLVVSGPPVIVGQDERTGQLHLRALGMAGTSLCDFMPRGGWLAMGADAWANPARDRCVTCLRRVRGRVVT